MTVCIDSFRQAIRQIPTPVAVVTTRDRNGVSHGMTVGSLGFVSLNPPMVQFSVAQRSSTHAVFTAADRIAVSVLGADQASVADQLAGQADERFRGCWQLKAGLLVVPGAASQLVCSVECRVPAGDHTLMLLRVTELTEPATPRSPLVRWKRTYTTVGAPVDLDERRDVQAASRAR